MTNFFKGKLNRKSFLIHLGIMIILSAVFYYCINFIDEYLRLNFYPLTKTAIWASVIWGIYGFIGVGLFLLPVIYTFSLFVRRLHDLGRPGAWAILFLINPGILIAGNSAPTTSLVPYILFGLMLLMNTLFLLYLLLAKSRK